MTQKYLDLADQPGITFVGSSAALRGTDGGICDTCHQLSATLINGKCPKHANLAPIDETTKQPDLLGNGAEKKKGGCWTKHGGGA